MVRRRSGAVAAVLAIGGVLSNSSLAATKCIDAKGRVTYQDTACENAASAQRPVDTSDAFSAKPNRVSPSPTAGPTANSPDPAYASAKGEWRGPVQFQLTLGGVRDLGAQVVTPMVIELKQDGEVRGVIPAAGCSLSGLTTQLVAAYMASVDVTLKGCRDERFNVRLSGYLTAIQGAREARMNLHGLNVRRPDGKFEQTSIEAVLKR